MESRRAGGGGKRGCIHGGPIIAAGGSPALRRRKVRSDRPMPATRAPHGVTITCTRLKSGAAHPVAPQVKSPAQPRSDAIFTQAQRAQAIPGDGR
ncbi:hypothetical protein CJO92_02490 [Ralstonia solanacearum]|uniref:Uncharacterized protein n=2 Tax=Ralstonia solanacearum species complex TaxID=3116862 RepID=A0AAD0WF64_RALSL|nr:hypothetical protein B0B51_13020 [blood disease bacterium A2-HR MARDI]AXV80493.1 hypothetical protein CJO77_02490 [Ralstonia solanacearum]AXW51642.1 hypothetical protein CJO92_02490 [Ralstonia solanacearum]